MTQESLTTLNTETLIGFTDRRGHAWHYRAALQGDEPNHYPGPVPVADVRRRLFHWRGVKSPKRWDVTADAETMTGIDANGHPIRTVTGTDQVIWRSDRPSADGDLGTVGEGYEIHQYDETLLDGLAHIITPDGLAVTSDSLTIGSAGLLRGGRQAWVQIEMPDNISTPEGVQFRPTLLAATSLDTSLKTTFCCAMTNVICDNTMHAAFTEADRSGHIIKIKHTRRSFARIADIRQALDIIVESAEAFTTEIADLCSIEVTDRQFDAFLQLVEPLNSDNRATRTKVGNRRDHLTDLYRNDPRVCDWAGTAFGVLQLMNTHHHHTAQIRKSTYRPARNLDNALTGKTLQADIHTLTTLNKALAMA